MENQKSTNSLKDGVEERIGKRLDKLRTREGYLYTLQNPLYPLEKRKLDEATISELVKKIEKNLPSIKNLIKAVRKFVPHIWDETNIAAVYLLLGKAFRNLETVTMLAKRGNNFEIIELARSGKESLDLAFLFSEEGHKELLKKWFKGKIIENEKARKAFHRAINKFKKDTIGGKIEELPVENLKKDAYWIYSSYTHSSYAALLDTIDVFKEDFDFERSAGFHYTVRNFHIIEDLVFNILFELKNIFVKFKDQGNLVKVEELLNEVGYVQASQKEINEIIEKYAKY